MNTRGDTIRSAPPRSTRHTRALPTAADHRQYNDDTPPRTRGATPTPATRRCGDDTATPGSPRLTGGPDDGRQTSSCGIGRKPRRPQASRPCPGGPPRTTRQRAAAQHTSPTPVGWARRRERRPTAQLMQRTPNKCGLALAALRPMMLRTNTDPTNPPNTSEFLPHPPGGGHAPRTPAIHQRQRRGRGPTRTCPSA